MMEQLGMIWLDYMFNYYDASRVIMYRENGELSRQTIDSERLRGVIFSCTVDAGASAYWSEISAVTTLDMLLKSGHISFIQYLERIPEGIIPRKNELIEQTKAELEKIQNERMTNNEGPQTDTPR